MEPDQFDENKATGRIIEAKSDLGHSDHGEYPLLTEHGHLISAISDTEEVE